MKSFQSNQLLTEENKRDIMDYQIAKFEEAMKTGKAVSLCPSCGARKEITLSKNRSYHWRRGKVIQKCSIH